MKQCIHLFIFTMRCSSRDWAVNSPVTPLQGCVVDTGRLPCQPPVIRWSKNCFLPTIPPSLPFTTMLRPSLVLQGQVGGCLGRSTIHPPDQEGFLAEVAVLNERYCSSFIPPSGVYNNAAIHSLNAKNISPEISQGLFNCKTMSIRHSLLRSGALLPLLLLDSSFEVWCGATILPGDSSGSAPIAVTCHPNSTRTFWLRSNEDYVLSSMQV